jgi:bacterioferritin-associated ferredoxin
VIVCSCRTVTDRTVDAAIASGAHGIEDLAERCGAGSRCGGCWPELERLIHEHQARTDPAPAAVA